MFVRLKRRALKSTGDEPKDSLRAYVVENQRINGSPRQRVVIYLSSIRQDELRNALARSIFFREANKRIATLSSDFHEIVRLKLSLAQLLAATRGGG